MIHPVIEPCHKPWQETKSGIVNSCLMDPTNLVSFCETIGCSGRDNLRKSRETWKAQTGAEAGGADRCRRGGHGADAVDTAQMRTYIF